jgi:hypothetical protein
MFEANNRLTAKLLKVIEAMEKKGLGALIEAGEYMAIWKFLEENLFGLK